jgi:AraC-like DNA-binding protein
VVEYISKNYTAKLQLEELAKLISCDKYRLCRRFKQITGGTVVDYIHFVRLRRAQELLTYSNCNITETAYACGFASVQHFNTIFKQYLGCTPSAYKKWIYQENISI